MTDYYLSAQLGLTLVARDDRAVMLDIATSIEFEPRAQELVRFFATRPVRVEDEGLRKRLDAFILDVSIARAIECVKVLDDPILSDATKASALDALEVELRHPGVERATLLALLSSPDAIGERERYTLPSFADLEHERALELICEFQLRLPTARELHDLLRSEAMSMLGEPQASVALDVVAHHRLVGRCLAGEIGYPTQRMATFGLLHKMAQDLPEDVEFRNFSGLVLGIASRAEEKRNDALTAGALIPAVPSGLYVSISASVIDRMPSILGAAVPASGDLVPSTPPVTARVAELCSQLYRAAALDSDPAPWTYLLDFALIADPTRAEDWHRKTHLLVRAKEIDGARRIEQMRHRVFAERSRVRPKSSVPPYHLAAVSPAQYSLTFDMANTYADRARIGKEVSSFIGRLRRYHSALAHTDLASALLQVARPTATPSGDVDEIAATGIRSHWRDTAILHSAGLGSLYPDGLGAVSVDGLVSAIGAYVTATAAAADWSDVVLLRALIDDNAPLPHADLIHYADDALRSPFLERASLDPERLRVLAPQLCLVLVGKLLSGGHPGGGQRQAADRIGAFG